MKLVTIEVHFGARHIGALLADGATCVDFTAADAAPHLRSMLDLIDGGPAASDDARRLLAAAPNRTALSTVRLLAPVPEPRQMRDFLSFEQHVRQARANRHLLGIAGQPSDPAKVELPKIWYEQPIYYKCNRFSVVGTGVDVSWPRASKLMDYELEFGVFIGKTGKNIRRADAMGPWLVTADEVPDPYALTMLARVNGKEWSRGASGKMQHKFEDIIAHVSADETLHAGEFLGSGTVGNGCGLELGRFLEDGDTVELEVTGLGVLRNRVLRQT